MITVDIHDVPNMGSNHRVIVKYAKLLKCEDFGCKHLDMIFFDCHMFDIQINLYQRLRESGVITDKTLIALHDTGVWPTYKADWCKTGV